MLLKSRGLFPAGELHPAETLQVGEINNEGMIITAAGLVRQTAQILNVEVGDLFRIYEALLAPGAALLIPGGPVQSRAP